MCGVAVGSDLAVSTAYITEISKKDIRGALGFLVQLMGSLGVLYTFALGYFLDWKWLAVANAAWVAPFWLSVLASPESPRWLLSKGRQYSASKSLAWLRGRGRPAEIEREIEALKSEIAFESRQRSSINALAAHGAWQPLLISLALVFFLNFSGIHVLLAYSTTVFALGGVADAVDPRTSTVALGAAVLFSCVASIGVLSRLRRRLRLLVVGSVLGMGLAQIVLALCFLYAEQREEGFQLALQEEEEQLGNATVDRIIERRIELEMADPLPEHVRWLPVCAVLSFIVIGELFTICGIP